jgi:hypothetical protein
VEEMIDGVLRDDPFEGFVLASRENNLDLGREAIRLMSLRVSNRDLWEEISGAKSSWQVALVKLVITDPMYLAKVYSGETAPLGSPIDWDKVAERFQPE